MKAHAFRKDNAQSGASPQHTSSPSAMTKSGVKSVQVGSDIGTTSLALSPLQLKQLHQQIGNQAV